MANLDEPIPLSDIEDVLAWVDTFKLSRQTKKINRDFSDAVLLAEILAVHYPKLVEMHNYPPRNSQALKLNNWMTLNRKVLKKLKLTLCYNTMELLANSRAGVIERVLINVRDKIRRDEELHKSTADHETNMSSGGSYYEACGAEDNVLVVPVKTRVNGVLEVIQQKVVNYESYMAMKMELKDAQDAAELLRQKVEHLDNMIKLKEMRIEELQKQLERKASRRKEVECLTAPFETCLPSTPITPIPTYDVPELQSVIKPFIVKTAEQPLEEFPDINTEEPPAFPKRLSATNIDTPKISVTKIESQPKISVTKIEVKPRSSIPRPEQPTKQSSLTKLDKQGSSKLDLEPKVESLTKLELGATVEARKSKEKPSLPVQIEVIKAVSVKSDASTDMRVPSAEVFMMEVDRVKSDIFQELEDEEKQSTDNEGNDPTAVGERPGDGGQKINDTEEFKDSEQEVEVCYQTITFSDSVKKELKETRSSTSGIGEMTYLN